MKFQKKKSPKASTDTYIAGSANLANFFAQSKKSLRNGKNNEVFSFENVFQ